MRSRMSRRCGSWSDCRRERSDRGHEIVRTDRRAAKLPTQPCVNSRRPPAKGQHPNLGEQPLHFPEVAIGIRAGERPVPQLGHADRRHANMVGGSLGQTAQHAGSSREYVDNGVGKVIPGAPSRDGQAKWAGIRIPAHFAALARFQ